MKMETPKEIVTMMKKNCRRAFEIRRNSKGGCFNFGLSVCDYGIERKIQTFA